MERVIVFLTACGIVCSTAQAGQLRLIDREQSIAPGKAAEFEFGTVPQADTTILLHVTARVHLARPSGSNFMVRIKLNGREVAAARSRTVVRLINRPLVSPVAANLPSAWFGSGKWRLLYAPDFESGRKSFYQGDPYTLVLDVTDLVNPAAENRLHVSNEALISSIKWKPPEGDLVIRDLSVETRPGASPTMAAEAMATPAINRGQPAAGPAAYHARLTPGGGLAINVGSRHWEVRSAFSYPNAGMNRLTPTAEPDRSGQVEWSSKVQAEDKGGQVVAAGPDYRLVRTVRCSPVKIEVADQLTNLDAKRPLGLLVRHELGLAEVSNTAVRLAGNPDPAVNDYFSAHNPSVHISLPDQGVGLLCEDDVFRNQARLFYTSEPPAAGLRTEMLRLGSGESYTLRWSIWPVAGPDYFDFINLVRAEWGSNFTVPGAWTFFHPDSILTLEADQIQAKFRRLGIRYACYCGGWVDPKHDKKRIGFGTGVLDDYWSDFRRRLRLAAEKIRAACPDVKVLVYYDTQRDTSETGHERFRDSWLTGPLGTPLSTEWAGRYSLTWSMVATLHNSYGKAMLQAIDRYVDEIGTNGLYWDEMEAVAYGTPLITHNATDGHSCVLDPKTYTIQREIGITTLLGQSHRLAVIKRVHDRGASVMGNGPACTRAVLATGVPRMVEIQHNDNWCYEGNLGTPLGYMSSRTDFGNVVRALKMACLPVGTRYDYEHEISGFLFPFTPIELHQGYLLGKERIITIHAGNFGWLGERCVAAGRHFDVRGKLTEKDFPTVIGREARTEVDPAEGEAVVLERLPVTIMPKGGDVRVSSVRYGAEGLSLRITAPAGATLELSDGAFPIRADRKYAVRVADERPKSVAIHKSRLQASIPPTADATLRVAFD